MQAYLTKPVIVFIFHRYCFPPARHNRTYSECSLLASLSPWKALCKDVTTFVGWKLHTRNHDPHNSIDVQKPRSCFVMQMATEPEKCQVCRFQGRKTVKCLLLLRKGFPPTDRKEDLPLTVEFMNSLATSQAICLWTILERRRKRKKKRGA